MTHPDRLAERLRLWFFRDLSSDQRLALFKLCGMPVDEIGDSHGHQRIVLDRVIRDLTPAALATPVPGAVSNAMVERAWDRLFPGNLTVISITKADLTTALEAAFQSPPIVGVRALIAFLNEAAGYFESRDTQGEDMAFWANASNAENCRKAASALSSLAPVEAVATEPVAELAKLREWKTATIGLCKALGSDDMHWGGDKTGWGFIHYFVKHLHTRATTAETALSAPTGDSGALREALDGLNLLLGQAIHHLRNHDIYTHKTYADLANELQVWAKEHRAALSKGEPGK